MSLFVFFFFFSVSFWNQSSHRLTVQKFRISSPQKVVLYFKYTYKRILHFTMFLNTIFSIHGIHNRFDFLAVWILPSILLLYYWHEHVVEQHDPSPTVYHHEYMFCVIRLSRTTNFSSNSSRYKSSYYSLCVLKLLF